MIMFGNIHCSPQRKKQLESKRRQMRITKVVLTESPIGHVVMGSAQNNRNRHSHHRNQQCRHCLGPRDPPNWHPVRIRTRPKPTSSSARSWLAMNGQHVVSSKCQKRNSSNWCSARWRQTAFRSRCSRSAYRGCPDWRYFPFEERHGSAPRLRSENR